MNRLSLAWLARMSSSQCPPYVLCLLLVALASACARAMPDTAPAAAAPSGASMTSVASVAAAPTTAHAPLDASGAPSDAAKSPDLPAPPETLEGVDFVDQARTLFRFAACGTSGEIPPRFDVAVVSRHCDELTRAYDDYKRQWVDVAQPFIAALRPKDLPTVVVYPFGGGDLTSALATFPDAVEFTTISLEPAGDVRPVDHLAPERLSRELSVHRAHLERLFEKAHSRTDNLEKESLAEVPGEIIFSLGALVVYGAEPVSLRYFRVKPDGSLAYVTQDDIDREGHHPRTLRALFDNAELRFRKLGDPQAPVRTLRHIAFNLDDDHLKADPGLLAHLSAKGKVAAMTKAATHLLWSAHFALIRGWLIDHTDWMASDSTGIPPRYAQPAGFTQDTFGRFDGPSAFGAPNERDANDLKRTFASQPPKELPFRYGYPDKNGHGHLVITRR